MRLRRRVLALTNEQTREQIVKFLLFYRPVWTAAHEREFIAMVSWPRKSRQK